MELRALRAFVTLAQTGSFTVTADKLHVTQPTVSKLLRQLEEKFGHPLFVRSTRKVSLTSAGRLLLVHAEAILAEMQQMEREISDLNEVTQGELHIGILPLGPRYFVALISQFKQRYPGVDIRLFEEGTHAIEEKLINGELEVGAMVVPIDRTRFDSCPALDDQLMLLAPARSRWARYPEVPMRDLEDESLILFTSSYVANDRIMAACAQAGFKPHVAGRSGQIGLIVEMVRAGVGVAFLPGSELTHLDRYEFAVCKLVEPEIEWRVAFGWLKYAALSPAARKWIETVGSCGAPEG